MPCWFEVILKRNTSVMLFYKETRSQALWFLRGWGDVHISIVGYKCLSLCEYRGAKLRACGGYQRNLVILSAYRKPTKWQIVSRDSRQPPRLGKIFKNFAMSGQFWLLLLCQKWQSKRFSELRWENFGTAVPSFFWLAPKETKNAPLMVGYSAKAP